MNHSSDKIKWGAWGANNQSKNNTITKQSIIYEYKHCNVTPHFLKNEHALVKQHHLALANYPIAL